MGGEHCLVERDGPLTIITINRPEAMNALHPPANQALADALDAFAVDPDQWVAIITGAGDHAFCAGNDLKVAAELAQRGERPAFPSSGFGGITSRFDLDKPVIAAVNGLALGGGFEIALACDIIIAADTASFGLTEARVGRAALAGGLHRLPRAIGLKPAMGMILTGRRVGAAEALALGLVNEVAGAGDLMIVARRWAAGILECSPMAVRAAKRVVHAGLDEARLADAIEGQTKQEALRALFKSSDFLEGPRAFAERRAPVWRA